MWKKITLTTANNTGRVSFRGRGSIYAEGTFGGGTVGLKIIYYAIENGPFTVASGFIDDPIDGSVVKSLDCPAGDYQLNLAGSVGATVDVYFNDQVEFSEVA